MCYCAALAVVAHVPDCVLARRLQRLDIFWTVVGAADGVELERPSGNADAVEQSGQHLEHLGVDRRRLAARARWADDLGTDLVELPVTPLLRTLSAKLRADVVELLQSWPLPQ